MRIMSSPTNLTDRLSHLRERRADSKIMSGSGPRRTPASARCKPQRERRFATDVFMLFTYSLLGLALLSQCILIIWLEFS